MAVTLGWFLMFFSRLCSWFLWFPRPKMASWQLGLLAVFGRRISRACWAAQVFRKSVSLMVKVDWHNSRIVLSHWCWFWFLLATSPHLCVPFGKRLERSLCYKYIYVLCMIIVIHVQYIPSSYCCHVACNHIQLPKTKTLLRSHGGEEGPTSQGVPGHAEDLNFTSSTTSGDETYRCL